MHPVWTDADRISDAIVTVVRHELSVGTGPVQILAGQLLGFKALLQTTPTFRPPTLDRLEAAIDNLLTELMLQYGKPED